MSAVQNYLERDANLVIALNAAAVLPIFNFLPATVLSPMFINVNALLIGPSLI